MTITAVAIVKDEEHVIGRMLDSVRQHVDDIVVVDTGSRDDTVGTCRRAGCDVYEREWVNFGYNRTEALELARHTADYLLLLDADDELVSLTPAPAAVAYNFQVLVAGAAPQLHPRLVAARVDWRYVGVTHEYLTSDLVPFPATDAPVGGSLIHHRDGSRWPRKLNEDLELLLNAYRFDRFNPRTVFYLANTLRDLGEFNEALILYRERVELGGWQAEVDAAAEQLARLERGSAVPVPVP